MSLAALLRVLEPHPARSADADPWPALDAADDQLLAERQRAALEAFAAQDAT